MSDFKSRHKPALAERICIAQEASGKTNEQVATEVGVALRVYQKWRAGDITPRYTNLRKLAVAVSVPLHWFFSEEPLA